MANADLFALSCHLYNRSQVKGKKNGALDAARTAPSRSNFSLSAFMLSLNSECGMLQRDIGSGKRRRQRSKSLRRAHARQPWAKHHDLASIQGT
jgi:hypothetical protein